MFVVISFIIMYLMIVVTLIQFLTSTKMPQFYFQPKDLISTFITSFSPPHL